MAEAQVAVAVDDDRHLVAAADPYRTSVRIEIVESYDGAVTWGPPVVVVPPGFDKSYDPNVVFADAGRIVVVGGASQSGEPFCQPGSVIFEAVIVKGTVSYRLVSGPSRPGVYVDRPVAARQRDSGRVVVTWTESSGPDAECRAVPTASVIRVTTRDDAGEYEVPISLPSSGLPAPFGATIALAADGQAWFAVGEHLPGQRSRLVVIRSWDGGRTFDQPIVLDESQDLPHRIAGIGGVFAPLPTITVLGDGQVVAVWSRPTLTGLSVRMWARTPGSSWTEQAPPSDLSLDELYPQITAGTSSTDSWLLTAHLSSNRLEFALRRHDVTGWELSKTIGVGPSANYSELGQLLGLARGAQLIATAVPLNRGADGKASLWVTVISSPPPTTTATTLREPTSTVTTTVVAPATVPAVDAHHGSRSDLWIGIVAAGALTAVALSLIRASVYARRRRGRSRRRRGISEGTGV